MQVLIVTTAFAIGFACAAPVYAEAWETGFARGLPTYSTSSEGGRLVLVCDPDRVYNPAVSYASFVLTLPGDPAAGQMVFLAASGQQAIFAVTEGTATQQDASPADWSVLIEIIRRGGQFAVVTPNETVSLDMEPMPGLRCN
jgi:hypothetical protein